MKPTNEQITAAARALSNDNADVCNVNREDNWNFYGDSFRETAKVALEAAMGVATAVDAGARDEREAFEVFARKELTFDTDTDPCKQGQSGYLDSNVDFAWIGWQARAALSATPAATLSTESVDKAVHKLTDAVLAAAATTSCYCRTGADGWIFGHVSELRELITLLAASDSQGDANAV